VLYLDSAPFKISAHLTDIFVHIQKPDVGRDLWIDAVCIDQTNDVERGRQVEMMGDIYQNCTADLAWIEDPKSEVSGNVEEIQLGSYKDWEAWLREFHYKTDGLGGDENEEEEETNRTKENITRSRKIYYWQFPDIFAEILDDPSPVTPPRRD